MNIEGISLDQLRAVLAVAEEGSFSAAARKFGRAQSAVSYAVQQTEQQLGLELFDRTGYRPQLTAAGRALVHDIRAIVARANDLTARARAVSRGVEAEISLAIDAICSPDAVGRLMAAFHAEFPTVAVRLSVETLGMVIERVREGQATLGVIATMIDLPDGLARYTVPMLRMAAVTAAEHALASCPADKLAEALQGEVQIVLSDRSKVTEGRDYGVFSPRTWRVDDLAAKHGLIRNGVGWGSLPMWQIERDLKEGRLKALRVPGLPEEDDMSVQAFHDAGHRPGPAMSWVLERLQRDGLS